MAKWFGVSFSAGGFCIETSEVRYNIDMFLVLGCYKSLQNPQFCVGRRFFLSMSLKTLTDMDAMGCISCLLIRRLKLREKTEHPWNFRNNTTSARLCVLNAARDCCTICVVAQLHRFTARLAFIVSL